LRIIISSLYVQARVPRPSANHFVTRTGGFQGKKDSGGVFGLAVLRKE